MNPHHDNPKSARSNNKGQTFKAVAPYNFVPLPEQVANVKGELPDHDQYSGHTGYIDCVLTTLTPLYTRTAMRPGFFREWTEKIRNVMADATRRAEYAEFFHLDDAQIPVIPGSSLRGMVRALVEIVGYGKMQWVTDEAQVFRAVGDRTSLGNYYRDRLMQEDEHNSKQLTPLMHAGYLEQNNQGWSIRPAKAIDGSRFARINHQDIPQGLLGWHECCNAKEIWIQPEPNRFQSLNNNKVQIKYPIIKKASSIERTNFVKCVLVESGSAPRKHSEAVIYPADLNAQLIPVPDKLVEAYREQVTKEQKKLLGPLGALNCHQPVFYLLEDGKLTFFGHPMMFRLPYEMSPLDFVPEYLRDPNQIDLVEAVFGFVPEDKHDKRKAYAGRIFFTDARLQEGQKDIWFSEKPITPPILASPKPTTFQHYLVQDSKKSHDPDQKNQLAHYGTHSPNETVIRGHKLYWHKESGQWVNQSLVEEDKTSRDINWANDTQRTQIKPVKEGVVFTFRIYFENLRDFELGELLWALMLPGDKEYRHKLGMGKPLGMGTVKLSPTLVVSKRDQRYKQLFEGDTWFTANHKDENEAYYLRKFEEWVLTNLSIDEQKGAKSLAEVERIRMMLKLLEWPGPAHDLTRYMTIQPNNEFKERPVLPDPENINLQQPQVGQRRNPQPDNPRHQSQHAQNRDRASKPNVTPQPVQRPDAKQEAHPNTQTKQNVRTQTIGSPSKVTETNRKDAELVISKPKTESEVQLGMCLPAKVIKIESGRIVMDIGVEKEASLNLDQIDPTRRGQDELREDFQEGKEIPLWVKGRNKKGVIQLTTKKPT